MQTEVIAAEQTSRNRYWRPAPLPPRDVELTVRMQIPDDDDTDVGIHLDFSPPVPEQWGGVLDQRLFDGVHRGLASVDQPLPPGGISIQITTLRITPTLELDGDLAEVHRIGDMLEALTSATVAALWTGLISLGLASAA